MRRVLATVGLCLALLLAAAPARASILDQLLPWFTGAIKTEGLSVHWNGTLTARRILLQDAAGTYATLDNVAIAWSPLRLLRGEVAMSSFTVQAAELERLPESSGGEGGGLGVKVAVAKLAIDRLTIAKPVAGMPVVLKVDGSGRSMRADQAEASLTATRLDGTGTYHVTAKLDARTITAQVAVKEGGAGLLAHFAQLPDLGPLDLAASVDGPRDALGTKLRLTAGPLRAEASGAVNLTGERLRLAVSVTAPAMAPRPDLSWQSVAFDAQVDGAFASPDVTGTLRIADLAASGGAVRQATLDIAGNKGEVRVKGQLAGVTLPGRAPDLLAAAPVMVSATAELAAPERPVRFTLDHPVLTASGTVQTAGARHAALHLTLPRLQPVAALVGVALEGRAILALNAVEEGKAIALGLDGTLDITGGMAPAPALVGQGARLVLEGRLTGETLALSRFSLNGKDVTLVAQGSISPATIDLDWQAALADLAPLSPALGGALKGKGHVAGPFDKLALVADLSGNVSASGQSSGPFTAHLEAEDLPGAPQGRLTATGALLGAPVDLALSGAQAPDGTLRVTIAKADWKSVHAEGEVGLPPGATIPIGRVRLSVARLEDLSPLVGEKLAGRVTATLDADAQRAMLTAEARSVALAGTGTAARASVQATIADPTTRPVLDGRITLDGVSAGGVSGSARIAAKGPIDALGVQLDANLPDIDGAAARLAATGKLEARTRAVTLTAFTGTWKQQTLRLRAPVRLGFAKGIEIRDLRARLDGAELAVNGRVSPSLDLTASARNVPARLAALLIPGTDAAGTLSAEARLSGSLSKPAGTIRLSANGLRMRGGPGQALPPATLTATATLEGAAARIEARASAGRARLSLSGKAPLAATAPLDLHLAGRIDLAMADPLIAAAGRRVAGTLILDAGIAGTRAAPALTGGGRLTGGDFRDYVQGLHIRDIAARFSAAGGVLRIDRLSARAGGGTLGGSGTIGVFEPGLPIDLRLTAANATPLSGGLVTATFNADLGLKGDQTRGMALDGTINVRHAEIRVPDKLPASVATIPVRIAGAPAAPPAPPGPPAPSLALNLTVAAPRQVFVRGRGLDAELGGTVRLRGTVAKMQPSGAFNLRRGRFDLVGQTLTFTSGRIDFDGGSITDPAIHFVATSTSGGTTATLTVSGTARDPKLALSSTPPLPQDEILAQLLFRTNTGSLSPFELASIAAGIAQLSGTTSDFPNPLEGLRQSLGLSQLGVGTGANGKAAVEAGRYIGSRVYVGAQQSTSGQGTQGKVTFDITRRLKLNATVGAGQTTSAIGNTGETTGESVGVTYQFEY